MATKKKGKQVALMSDLEFMKATRDWPLWPYLPVKKPPCPELGSTSGLLWAYDVDRGRVIIYGAFIYKMPPTRDDFLATKFKEYPSLEAMAADGWVVD
jgi:hypothetical protein